MEASIMVALIGGTSTIVAALIGYFAVQKRDKELELLRDPSHGFAMLTPGEYGIEIVKPRDFSRVSRRFEIAGTYRVLPKDQHIWLSTFHIVNDKIVEYWPQSQADADNGVWSGVVENIGGESGTRSQYLVLVVGREAEALFAHFKKVGQHPNFKDKDVEPWIGISNLTSDIVQAKIGTITIE